MKKPMRIAQAMLLGTCLISFNSCKKESQEGIIEEETPAVITIESTQQFRGEIDGKTYTYDTGGSSWTAGYGTSPTTDLSTNTGTGTYENFFWNTSTQEGSVGLDKSGLTYQLPDPTVDQFNAFFAPGSYAFDALDGFTFYWEDSGTSWSTNKGSGDQSNSSIEILDVVESGPSAFGLFEAKIHCTFTCTLYDDNGNSKSVTNADYVAAFRNL